LQLLTFFHQLLALGFFHSKSLFQSFNVLIPTLPKHRLRLTVLGFATLIIELATQKALVMNLGNW
jgi:hypothetical protein